MDFKRFISILKKRFLFICLITFAITLAAGYLSYFVITPIYKADISVIIGNSNNSNEINKQNYDDVLMYQKMVKTYSKLIKSRIVAEDVIKNLKLEPMSTSDLLESVTVTPDNDTQFLTIAVLSKDTKQAMNIANQFAKSLKSISMKVNEIDIVEIIDEAQLPIEPESPKPIRNIIMAFFVGNMLSIGFAIMSDYLDNTIKTEEDVQMLLGIPVLGTISKVNLKEMDVIV
ncbi:YveK family protein [Candidatus Clostridium radicumherbarum]|uniref:YveK family protein n=1 Tax=Candidatus Clostridium radicumherbarum TaxID=3381662 RepID=A0ABW8TP50_9CLOT